MGWEISFEEEEEELQQSRRWSDKRTLNPKQECNLKKRIRPSLALFQLKGRRMGGDPFRVARFCALTF